MQHQLPWIGYASVEGLVANVDPGRTIYLNATTELRPAGHAGINFRVYGVRVSHLTPEAIHYVEIGLGEVLLHAEGAFDPDVEKKAVQRAEDAERIIGDWLRSRGFRVVKASIAEPHNLKLLRGGTEIVTFDKEAGRLVAAGRRNDG